MLEDRATAGATVFVKEHDRRLWLESALCPGTNPVCAPLDSRTSSPERIGTEENEPLTARPTWLQNGGIMEDCHGDAERKEFA